MLLSWSSSLLIIHCLTVCTCRGMTVHGFEGQKVTLPCRYNSINHGKCEICWMRGEIPSTGCGSEIIATDGDKVTRKTSERYQLPGDIKNGDVSLTILIAKQSDSGIYGCRVHVPGWFNDEKNIVRLEIMQESVSTAPVNITDITTTRPWSQSETPRGNSVNESITSLPESSKNVFDTMDDKLPGIVVSVLLVLLTVVIVAIYLMWKHKRRSRLSVQLQQNFHDTIIYSNSDSSLGLHNRAVDNIYQLDTENEYERWS